MACSDVCFALVGSVPHNSRALRQLRALAQLGLSIEAFGVGPPVALPADLQSSVRYHSLPLPEGQGPRFFWQLHRQFLRVLRSCQARIYHAGDLYVLPALARTARRFGGRLVFDARERYPYVASTAGRPLRQRFWKLVERHYIRQADLVLTVSEGIAVHLVHDYGIASPLVLYNAPEAPAPTVQTTSLRQHLQLPDHLVLFLYQGHLRPGRGCLLPLEALPEVPEAALVYLGDGPLAPVIRERATTLGVADRVHLLPPVLPDKLLPVTASADVGLVLLEDTCLNHRLALPNKLFEYLAAGLPVLASNLPELRRVVETYGVGYVVDTPNLEALTAAMRQLCGDPALRRRLAARTSAAFAAHSWARLAPRFQEAYQKLLCDVQPTCAG
ncbi:glycosyltransferase [Rhodothermus profundi]|uniref:Glycosyltransferase involved in cell wall bisynthesis n=1 Tax=Rhodothermus profundi TaxID=633813 RepID=A0A1M6QK40_9BACT|nr:glycosyltransferase [Rhodothermus profundi]SHK20397.1 Glycosyltransferase involved in cell wall bisynthesis [Rhodothermus profundi]